MSPETKSRPATIASWVAQLAAAGILGMAAFMKLTSQADSIALFQAIGVEPWGRYLVGSAEVIAVAMLLQPRTARHGGLMAIVLMLGAITTHLFRIGITYGGDPSLFIMAVVVLLCGSAVMVLRKP
jgi:uncharacterized membrane protein YphA (DoxX/SURF4 family)